jgi:hypothetical protein
MFTVLFPRFGYLDVSLSRSSYDIQCWIKENTLTLHVARFDNVVETCPFRVKDWAPAYAFHLILGFCLTLPAFSICGSKAETLWRTLIGDTSLEGRQPAPKVLGESSNSFAILQAACW